MHQSDQPPACRRPKLLEARLLGSRSCTGSECSTSHNMHRSTFSAHRCRVQIALRCRDKTASRRLSTAVPSRVGIGGLDQGFGKVRCTPRRGITMHARPVEGEISTNIGVEGRFFCSRCASPFSGVARRNLGIHGYPNSTMVAGS